MQTDNALPVRRRESPPATLWTIVSLALAPFPVSALVYAYGAAGVGQTALNVLLGYSAVVLSFLGGVRWGLESALPRPRASRLLASVIWPVSAWLLILARGVIADSWVVVGLLAAFLLQWTFDHRGPNVPARYPRLSTTLTGAACVSLALVLEKALNA